MLRRVDLRGVIASGDSPADTAALRQRLPRPRVVDAPPIAVVSALCDEVRDGGDSAVRAITRRIDGCELRDLQVARSDWRAALDELRPDLRAALEVASGRVDAFHRPLVRPHPTFADATGVTVESLLRPVERVGVYVPGGSAPLLSSVIMTVVPARAAGVAEVVLATAPGPDGHPAPGILAAAELVGVDEFIVGNSTALIAAMAYGTASIGKVDMIVGPGGAFTAQAKREVAARGLVGVPSSFAGPSEVVVIADNSVPAEFAAVDLIVQIEHGPDGLAWLICWSEQVADDIETMLDKLLARSERSGVIGANLETNAWTALVDGPEEAIAVANAIAPEHLQLLVTDPQALLGRVHHAGTVFCGPWAPASLGDYVAGPSHVLPTFGSARFAGALGVEDFLRHIHVVSADEAALRALAGPITALAEAEGLGMHASSIRLRIPEVP